MKKKFMCRRNWIIAIAIIIAILSLISLASYFKGRRKTVQIDRNTPVSDYKKQAELKAVGGKQGSGQAGLTSQKGSSQLKLSASGLPELADGQIYKAWLYKEDADKPNQYYSLGQLKKAQDGTWDLQISSSSNLSDYKKCAVTLQKDADSTSPGEVILKGDF